MASSVNSSSNGLEEVEYRVWKIYKSLSNAPEEVYPVRESALSLFGAIRLIDEQAQHGQLSALDKRALSDYITRSNALLSGLEESFQGLRAQTESLNGLLPFAQKLSLLAVRVTTFHEMLRRGAQERILNALEEMREMRSEEFQQSLVTDWSFLAAELHKLGISEELVEEEYFFINSWLRDTYLDAPTERSTAAESSNPPRSYQERLSVEDRGPRIELTPAVTPEDEELPGYQPGSKKINLSEKADALDQATLVSGSNPIPQQDAEGSSKAAPPAYTFEDGSDQEIDDEFLQYIRRAVDQEQRNRYLKMTNEPDRVIRPYTWLPPTMQTKVAGRPDVIRMLDANSFTVMAYETAPRCTNELERLLPLLRLSGEHSSQPINVNEGVYAEAISTLNTISKAIPKFTVIQDQRSDRERFSDLDALDFEFTTAVAGGSNLQFPEREFDLAQKKYYSLLTYIMGMLELFNDLFPGRTYVTRSVKELEKLWVDRRMAVRTAYVEKELATWQHVEAAVLVCRDWHRLRPDLRDQAVTALMSWQRAANMLNASDLTDEINLTIISASGLPKARIGQPNYMVKVVLFGSSRTLSGHWRDFEAATEPAKGTQFPVWNYSVRVKCPKAPRFIIFEVCDRSLGRDKEVGRLKLEFSIVPGSEATLADKSLIFGYDEEVDFPLKLSEGKGKEVVPPALKIAMKWKGRLQVVADAGFPTHAPGKLFRKELSAFPLPFAEEVPVATSKRRL